MKRTIIAAAAILAVALGGAATPASAAAAQQRAPRPGLADDVYLYHPVLQSVLQTPPLETLIRFRTEAYTNFYPQAFHMVVHLYRWRSAIQLHRPRGAWVEIHPTVTYGIADLPGVGTHAYLTPPADWTCEPGHLYIRVHAFGITHSGHPASEVLFFPWARFNRKHPNRGNMHKPPALRQAWGTKCQGHDTLIG
jgi:hypothetical protein